MKMISINFVLSTMADMLFYLLTAKNLIPLARDPLDLIRHVHFNGTEHVLFCSAGSVAWSRSSLLQL
jgi:hypothetical protein